MRKLRVIEIFRCKFSASESIEILKKKTATSFPINNWIKIVWCRVVRSNTSDRACSIRLIAGKSNLIHHFYSSSSSLAWYLPFNTINPPLQRNLFKSIWTLIVYLLLFSCNYFRISFWVSIFPLKRKKNWDFPFESRLLLRIFQLLCWCYVAN